MIKNGRKIFLKKNLSDNIILKNSSNPKFDFDLFKINNGNGHKNDNNFPFLPDNNNSNKIMKKRSASSKNKLKIKNIEQNKNFNLNEFNNLINNKGDIIDIKRNYEINEINRNLGKTKSNFNYSNSKSKDKNIGLQDDSTSIKFKINYRSSKEAVKLFGNEINKKRNLSKNEMNKLIKNNNFIQRHGNGIKIKKENRRAFKDFGNLSYKKETENKEEYFNSKSKVKMESLKKNSNIRLSNNKKIQIDMDQKEQINQKCNEINHSEEDERMTQSSKEIKDNNNNNDLNSENIIVLNQENNDFNSQLKDESNEIEEKNDNLVKKNEEIEKNKIQEIEEYKIRLKKNFEEKNKELIQKVNQLQLIIEKLQKEKDDNNKIEMKEINELKEKNKTLISNNEELKKENETIKQNNNDLILKYKELKKNFNDIIITYEEIQKSDPLKLYIAPTLIGLNNIGATCFMNSTLQCLSQTKDLVKYFLKQKTLEKKGNNDISLNNKSNCRLYSSFLELIQKLWDKNGSKSYSPTDFMNVVNEINPLFKTGQAGDAKDFIIFILEQLHKELRISVNSNNNTNLEQLNQYDKNNALNYFFKDFKNQVSIISDIFYGFNETTNECLNCKNVFNFKGLKNPI